MFEWEPEDFKIQVLERLDCKGSRFLFEQGELEDLQDANIFDRNDY
jgi:hypothetical protein